MDQLLLFIACFVNSRIFLEFNILARNSSVFVRDQNTEWFLNDLKKKKKRCMPDTF